MDSLVIICVFRARNIKVLFVDVIIVAVLLFFSTELTELLNG